MTHCVFEDFYIVGPDPVRTTLYAQEFTKAAASAEYLWRPKNSSPSRPVVLACLPAKGNERPLWLGQLKKLNPTVSVIVVDEVAFDPAGFQGINLTLHIHSPVTSLKDLVRKVYDLL